MGIFTTIALRHLIRSNGGGDEEISTAAGDAISVTTITFYRPIRSDGINDAISVHDTKVHWSTLAIVSTTRRSPSSPKIVTN
ncbi:hypothetical protein PHJA_000505800 [Phtheirospermum japonicum]|uniref:Uncharacterized protein n=1 Tax=Phtheirospermum japonicum TaxID=374723 RepID=A0A830BFS9_9LAMI|nr:hypothetical protein PHJA_000505800 [Phtheirospermum japonicum]